MLPAYRVAIAGLLLAAACLADDAVAGPECALDVCTINIIDNKLIRAPCAGYSVLVAYSQINGATMIQCSKPMGESKSFIYDRLNRNAQSFEFSGGRFIRPDYLGRAKTDGIPSTYGPLPLCPDSRGVLGRPGELWMAERRPPSSASSGYCYRMYGVRTEHDTLAVRSESGSKLPPLPERAVAQWKSLRDGLSRYLRD
jgi:hypothetical protein